jgi:P-type Ca2+ transporter type 2C
MTISGLSAAEALDRLSRFGPNVVPVKARSRLPARVVNQLRDPLLIVLMIAATLTVVNSGLRDARWSSCLSLS